MSFRPERKRSGGIYPSCRNYQRKVKSATWVDPSTPVHFGRDDMSGGWFRFVRTGYNRNAPGTAHRPFHTVSLMGCTVQPHGLYSKRGLAMNHRRYIGYTVYRVISFNQTGYLRNVAGGRLPPLRTHRQVIPLIRTGYSCNAPGTAHRPFPTVSLVGVFSTQRISKTDASVPKNCQL